MRFSRIILILWFVLMTFISLQIIGCSASGSSEAENEETPEVTEVTIDSGSLSLSTSQASVLSDNSESATITAIVLDYNNAVVEGIEVAFSASGGQISASTAITDASGEAKIDFSAGTVEKRNRTVVIIATVTNLTPWQIPIQITGTTLTLSPPGITSLEIGGDNTAALTIVVQDATLNPIYDAQVALSVDSSSTGAATLSLYTGNTDVNGKLEVDVTGTGVGDVTVRAEALGASATKEYTIGSADNAFGITSPEDDPSILKIGSSLNIIVSAPDQSSVGFATTVGKWDGGTSSYVSKPVSGGVASARLNSSQAGVATVQVFDAGNPSITDFLTVAISAAASDASQIILQTSSNVVEKSSGDVSNTATLAATVRNFSGQVVGNAPVVFTIDNPTGGGETVFPVIVYTDDYGIAQSTFTSGSLSSGAEGVTIIAKILGTVYSSNISIVIGGTAGSIVIGTATKAESINNNTAYKLPTSVLVSDSNGNAMAGVDVSLNLWPKEYNTGFWTEDCDPFITDSYENEDSNRNLILDEGEDFGPDPGHGDGELTPPISAAGTVPTTVTTDENGVANFSYIYLKEYAVWITTTITASTVVLGTETTSTLTFSLPWIEGDSCYLNPSPFNGFDVPYVNIDLPPDGASFNDSIEIEFTGSGYDDQDGLLTGSSLVWNSDVDGQIGTGTTFSSTLSAADHTITLTGTDSDGLTSTDTVTITVTVSP